MTKKTLILAGFIVLKFMLQYSLISPHYDLQRDEYLHLDQAHYLAWGYLSVPPVTSWISSIIYFLGNSVFWVKFFPALFGALVIVVIWKTIEELNGNLFALILGATCVLFSALLRLNTLFQPNSFDVLSWTVFYFIIIKYIRTENQKWIFIGAVVFAIGFMNKYNIVFCLIGLLPAILLTEHRRVFVLKEFYLASLFGLLLVMPNLYWQYENHFPVVHHLRELADTQLVNVDRVGFLKSQLFFFIGSLFVIISALYALLFYKPFEKYKPFFAVIIFTLTVFIYFKAKDYYAIGLYPIYISFGSVFLGDILKDGWRKYLRPVAVAVPVLFFIPMSMVFFPDKSPQYILTNATRYKELGLLRWEDGKDHQLPQDFADMFGWKELAGKVDSICSKLPNLDETLVLCDNYGEAGAINYYKTNKKIVACSFDADYINWIRFDRKIKDVVLIKEADDEDKDRKVEKPFFDSVYLAGKRINQFAREQEISIYVLRGAKIDVNKRIKDEMDRKKSNWQ
ncbi:glycosyltransferase family 39 protein [Flavihumibacter profundi]|uniref:glycosyltransferase family 39 protein n=1 Tax=Flavihumibacter profundi TaxID=2716883 RepID=UPI001CC59843|nr:glycosyltransferase family 39 protein [Flavihumibacter profundi]MBZ5856822.1 glycosyltransferase family 39 protein [Flavihumibacter profundi]